MAPTDLTPREEAIVQYLSDGNARDVNDIHNHVAASGHTDHLTETFTAVIDLYAKGALYRITRMGNLFSYVLASTVQVTTDPTRPVTQRGTPSINDPLSQK